MNRIKKLIPNNLKKIMLAVIQMKNSIFGLVFRVFPINNKKICITSYYGKGYGDNMKYIVEYIIANNVDLEIVWLFDKNTINNDKIPSEIKKVRYNSLKSLYELATSKIWLDNCRKKYYTPKRKGQYYIQTWHGGLGLKKIEKDVEDSLNSAYKMRAKKDSELADYMISNSSHLTNIYKKSFWYNGPVLEYGYPKNDIFFNDNQVIIDKVRNEFGIAENDKVILYAPTFRKDLNLNSYDVDFNQVIKTLSKKTGDVWKVFVRMHPHIGTQNEIFEFNNNIIDTTSYPDMQELVIASDMMISDYSSSLFDAAIQLKPTFIYASDLEVYMDDRGFYFPLEDLPFPLAKNNEEMLFNIETFNIDSYLSDLNRFHKDVGLLDDGQASSRVSKFLQELSTKEV